MWAASVGVLVAASVVDAHSSWGKPEANRLLANGQGRFGGRGVALKGLLTGAAVGLQWVMVRKGPEGGKKAARVAAVSNFAMAAAYGVVIRHNYGNGGPVK
jgi:hypothetical protein